MASSKGERSAKSTLIAIVVIIVIIVIAAVAINHFAPGLLPSAGLQFFNLQIPSGSVATPGNPFEAAPSQSNPFEVNNPFEYKNPFK